MLVSGHKIVYWSIEAGEWGRREHLSAEELADYVVQHLRPRDVLLLHDDNPKTVTILRRVLPHIRQQGWDVSQGLLV
jgi:peptidoglycan/xylan/chitin deacetylase (PgdA/CDA1 family)